METVQLISMLFDSMNSEYIQENIDKIINLLGCAAKTLEKFVDENKQLHNDLIMQQALAQNGQSAIETNEHLIKRISALLKDFKELSIKSEDACKYCEHYQPCDGKNCKGYIEGKGAWDYKHCYYDWVWSCEDFNYGECPKLENTPCNGCNVENNWEWRGIDE